MWKTDDGVWSKDFLRIKFSIAPLLIFKHKIITPSNASTVWYPTLLKRSTGPIFQWKKFPFSVLQQQQGTRCIYDDVMHWENAEICVTLLSWVLGNSYFANVVFLIQRTHLNLLCGCAICLGGNKLWDIRSELL